MQSQLDPHLQPCSINDIRCLAEIKCRLRANTPDASYQSIDGNVRILLRYAAIAGDAQVTSNGSAPTTPTIKPTIVTYGTSPSSLTSTVSGDGKYYTQTYAGNYSELPGLAFSSPSVPVHHADCCV